MLVSVEDLATYMDQPRLTNRQEDAAELVLVGLQSELEAILRRPVEPIRLVEEYVVAEQYLFGRSTFLPFTDEWLTTTQTPYSLALRNSPVVSVEQVRVKLIPWTTAWQVHTPGHDYVVRKWGIDLYRVNPNDKVEVTYTGGLDGEAIPFLKLSILRAAAREMTNQVDDVVGLKDIQTQSVPIKQTGFTPEEIALLRRWKRKQPVG